LRGLGTKKVCPPLVYESLFGMGNDH
jgi:hypothetical protein